MEIKHVTNWGKRYKQLPFGTVRTVRELKLNRRKKGSRGGINKPIVLVESNWSGKEKSQDITTCFK